MKYCDICKLDFNSHQAYYGHVRGKLHLEEMDKREKAFILNEFLDMKKGYIFLDEKKNRWLIKKTLNQYN